MKHELFIDKELRKWYVLNVCVTFVILYESYINSRHELETESFNKKMRENGLQDSVTLPPAPFSYPVYAVPGFGAGDSILCYTSLR